MTKNSILAIFFAFILIMPILSQEAVPDSDGAAEKKDNSDYIEYREVDGLENWSYNYDISDLEDGKYNLIIRSRDKAGNVSIDGPINIFVDSESDLPVISISSPSPFMRIGGNITVVGTASDDDGIASVEVKLDDGVYTKAEGKEFWSSFLDVSNIEDGRHTVTARVTDINGLQGHESSVIINIDKIKPVITIDSHSNGEILSGREKISGFVYDANGVTTLEYSLDGETYNDLKLSGKAEETEREFSLDLDTRDNEGGTSYVRFRTVDGTGSEGSTVFVYYSDNEKPEIFIVSPLEEEVLNGYITVTGIVTDEVGIQSFFSTQGGDDPVEIPLISGNPYWSRTFDLRGEKNSVITFNAVDLSGNTEEHKMKLKLDPEIDKPVISLVDFTEEEYVAFKNINGIASDDDGIKSVEYILDANEIETIDTEGPFLLDLEGLAPGKHSLQINAVDQYDIKGEVYKYSFLVADSSPQIELREYTTDKTIESYFDGVVFQQGKAAKISGLVNGGEGDISVHFTIGSEEEKILKASKGLFSISLPKLEPGAYDISVKAIDALNRESSVSSRIYFAPPPAKDEEYVPVQQDRADLFLVDSRLDTGGPANISSNNPITGYITGDTIRNIELIPSLDSFSVSKEGSRFSITPVSESSPVTFTVKVTSNSGKEYVSRQITAGSDFSDPLLITQNIRVPVKVVSLETTTNVEVDEFGEEVSTSNTVETVEHNLIESFRIEDTLILTGEFSDISEITLAEITFTGSSDSYGTPRVISAELIEGKYIIDEEIDLSSMAEGQHFLTVAIVDVFQNSARQTIPFIVDRTAPTIDIKSPDPQQAVEGIITVSGVVGDFNGGGQVLFSADGIEFNPIKMDSLTSFSHNIDLSAENVDPEKFLFRAIDRGRNLVDIKPQFNVDLESDRPKVAIEVPSDGSTIRNDFSVTGLVFDDDAVSKIYYSLDGDDFREIEGNFYYNIPFSLKEINDGRHTISVRAEDSGGFMSEVTTASFLISKEEPSSTLISPEIDNYKKSTILLEGESSDENGIDSVFISYDNGVTYNEAILIVPEVDIPENIENTTESENENSNEVTESEEEDNSEPADEPQEVVTTVSWKYTLDTRLPGDGTHSILIKAVDGAGTIGISSTILNIDNTFPEIKLDSPSESDVVAGTLVIDGKVFDGTRIKTVITELKALDDEEFPGFTNEINTEGVFRDVIDLAEYKPGWYNLNITVTDFADNSISETRNLHITTPEEVESVELYFPEEGKEIYGAFAVEGRLTSIKGITKALLNIDGSVFDTVEIDEMGLFSFTIEEGALSDGRHIISVSGGDSEAHIESAERNILYGKDGSWVRVDNIHSGQFVSGRPMVTGSAGISGLDEEVKKVVSYVEVSLDNGKIFERAKGKEEWEYRLETYDLPEGENQLLIRAHFKDGSSAVTKVFVNVDETAPVISLFSPEENRRFNENVALEGTAGDENGLSNVEVLIRKGSKQRYEVPSFIQGLYLDIHAMGSTYAEVGIGLSFFDDVVKLQVQAGLAPPGRFTGLVFGAKLLATIVDVPFSYFFGYDWDFFSMSLAVGANFNYFTMSTDGYSFTDSGVVLGAVLVQYEFAKFELDSLKYFNSYSLYAEGSLWFISSDIEAGVTASLSFGARIGIF